MIQDALTKTYTNIIPLIATDSENKVDIFDIFDHIQLRVAKWMTLFYDAQSFDADMHTAYNNTALFRHFFVASKNIQKLNGPQTFGFGFPIALDKDSAGNIISAPLFIWYLQIKPHPTQSDSWIISFDENGVVVPNTYFLRQAKLNHGIDLTADFQELLHLHPFGQSALEDFCKKISKKLNYTNPNTKTELRECPKLQVIESLATLGDIVFCGVLGLFPHQQGALNENVYTGLDFKNELKSDDRFQVRDAATHTKTDMPHRNSDHEFSVLNDDAAQRDALRTVLRNKITVVEGAYGTGKTYLAANIILNALSNGQKTAVIANDVASLMEIQNKLVDLGLGHLTFLLKDIYHDKKLFLDVLNSEQSRKNSDFDKENFLFTLKQARRFMSETDEQHENLTQTVFGNESVTDIAGKYLSVGNSRQGKETINGKELLMITLKPEDFDLSLEEHSALRQSLTEAAKLYPRISTLKHPLNELNEIYFAKQTDAGYEVLEKILYTYVQRLSDLRHEYIQLYDAYAEQLIDYYEKYHFVLRKKISELKNAYSDYRFQYGDSFESNNFLRVSGLYASSLFSDKSKDILSAKDEIVKNYVEIEKIHGERKYFPHLFLKSAERKDFKKVENNLEEFDLIERGWRKSLPRVMQEELQRLNSKSALYFDKDFSRKIKSSEDKMDALIADINYTPVFSQPLVHNMLTIPKRMQFIDETIEKLNTILLALRDYVTFSGWQQFWLLQPLKTQKLIQALVKTAPENWLPAFDSWYYYNILLQNDARRNINDDSINNNAAHLELNATLKDKLPSQIAYVWNQRKRILGVPALNFAKKTKSGAQNAKSELLSDILKKNINIVTEIFPVLLITPQVATQIVENDGKEFDRIIFDNAQNMDTQQAAIILRNTHSAVILNEYAHNEGFPVTSLAGLARANGAAVVRLNRIHHRAGQNVQRFNEAVFYKDVQIPTEVRQENQELNWNNVAGKYNSDTRINEREIAEVGQILETIEFGQRKLDIAQKTTNALSSNYYYPKIGIVCMGEVQRNALAIHLLNIVQKSLYGWQKIEQMQRNGLVVCNINEMTGQHFDIMIVSGTFSDINSDIENFLTKQKMRQLLNSFNKKLYWINSIPLEQLENARQENNNEVHFLIGNMLLWCHYSALNNKKEAEKIFQTMKTQYGFNKLYHLSPFVDVVAKTLGHYIPREHIKKSYKIADLIFDLVILNFKSSEFVAPSLEVNPTTDLAAHRQYFATVIRFDGQLQHAQFNNAEYELCLQQVLEKNGAKIVFVSSFDWWKNKEAATEKLLKDLKES